MATRDIKPESNIGELQARLSNEIISFEKSIMGRGPEEVRSHLVDDMVIMRLKSVLTRAEMKLLEDSDSEREAELIKEFRLKLFEKNRGRLEEIIENVTGRRIRSMHTDLNTRAGERVIICVLY